LILFLRIKTLKTQERVTAKQRNNAKELPTEPTKPTQEMPGKWQIINGVKYPVEDHASPTPHEDEEEVYLPRSYWKAKAQAQKEGDAAITIQKYARRLLKTRTQSGALVDVIINAHAHDISVIDLWPEACQALIRKDFRAAAIAFREAYEKIRGWSNSEDYDDSVPFTTQQMLLLELILLSEVNAAH